MKSYIEMEFDVGGWADDDAIKRTKLNVRFVDARQAMQFALGIIGQLVPTGDDERLLPAEITVELTGAMTPMPSPYDDIESADLHESAELVAEALELATQTTWHPTGGGER